MRSGKLWLVTVLLGIFLIPATARSDGPVQVVAVGDIALAWRVEAAVRNRGFDPFASVRSVLLSADLAFANLEGVLTTHSEPRVVAGRFPVIVGAPSVASVLSGAGFDVVSLANNQGAAPLT